MSATSPDRRNLSSQRVWMLTALVGAQLWAALSSLPSDAQRRSFAAEAAVLCAVLAMFGLRSVPIRWIVRSLSLLSGLLLARFGELGAMDGIVGSWRVLVWLAATAAALTLAPSSRSVVGREPDMVVSAADLPALVGSGPPGGVSGSVGPGSGAVVSRRSVDYAGPSPWTGDTGRRAVAVMVTAAVSLVGATALLVGPRVSALFPVGPSAGGLADLTDNRDGNSLVASESLDMTRRPALTPRVVMTVRSDIAAFWRAETYDTWDGSTWTRSAGRGGGFLTDGRVLPPDEDLAAAIGEDSEQEFRMELGYATAVPSAATPVRIDSTYLLDQRPDGTIVAVDQPLSKGSTYRVRSRQVPTNPAKLAATEHSAVPDPVLDQYAARPIATGRTVDLVERITAGLDGDYQKVTSLEQWMNDNTTYSLDAPLAPTGVDVVDHFLFESRQGWCEQIASSLVVMARLAGVPARLATGFTPGEWDPVGGRFVVRERDAHAWAEVWFPEHGWITFDPTAQVPLAGTAEATPGASALDWREVAGFALALVGVSALVASPLGQRVRRRLRRMRQNRGRRRAAKDRWDVAEELRLERLGAEAGRPRARSETVTAYAKALSSALDDPEVADVGVRIDRERYGPSQRSETV